MKVFILGLMENYDMEVTQVTFYKFHKCDRCGHEEKPEKIVVDIPDTIFYGDLDRVTVEISGLSTAKSPLKE